MIVGFFQVKVKLILYYAILYTILHYTMLYYTILYYIILYYTIIIYNYNIIFLSKSQTSLEAYIKEYLTRFYK